MDTELNPAVRSRPSTRVCWSDFWRSGRRPPRLCRYRGRKRDRSTSRRQESARIRRNSISSRPVRCPTLALPPRLRSVSPCLDADRVRFDDGQTGVVVHGRDPCIERLAVPSAPAAVLKHCQADLATHAQQRDAHRSVWSLRSSPESAHDSIRGAEPSFDLPPRYSFISGRLRGASGTYGVESDCAGELCVRVGPENFSDLRRLARQASRLQHRLRPGWIPSEHTILRQAIVEPAIELSRGRLLRPGGGDVRRHRTHARRAYVQPPVVRNVQRGRVLPVEGDNEFNLVLAVSIFVRISTQGWLLPPSQRGHDRTIQRGFRHVGYSSLQTGSERHLDALFHLPRTALAGRSEPI